MLGFGVTLPMPPGRFYADRFLFEHRGERSLFFEDGDARTELGAIVLPRRRTGPTRTAAAHPRALPYPFVFEHDGAFWMIPETALRGRIERCRAAEILRCRTFDRVLADEG